MNLIIDVENEILIATLSGRLDAFGAEKLQTEIQEKIAGTVTAA